MPRLAAAAALIALAPAAALAVEGESTLSVTPRFSTLTVQQDGKDVSGVGGGLAVDYQRALSDTFWLRAAVGGALHEGPLHSATASAGLTYTIDVIRYVPYVGAGLGLALVGGDAVDTAAKPFIELDVGLDVLQSRSWSWGIDARFSSFASGLVLFEVGPRISMRWGYF